MHINLGDNSSFYNCVLSYLAINASEAGGDLVLIQTSSSYVNANWLA